MREDEIRLERFNDHLMKLITERNERELTRLKNICQVALRELEEMKRDRRDQSEEMCSLIIERRVEAGLASRALLMCQSAKRQEKEELRAPLGAEPIDWAN